MRPIKLIAVGFALLAAAPFAAFAEETLEDPGRLAAVQKRKFRLDHELFASATALPWDAFSKGIGPTGSYTWRFSDQLGWEVVRGSYSFGLKTGLRDQLEKDFNVSPTKFDRIDLAIGSALYYSPLYGKFSIANRKVVHAELFGLVGGTVAYFRDTDTFKPGPQLGLGGRFFLNEWLSWRFEGRYDLLVGSRFTNVVELSTGLSFNLGGTD